MNFAKLRICNVFYTFERSDCPFVVNLKIVQRAPQSLVGYMDDSPTMSNKLKGEFGGH